MVLLLDGGGIVNYILKSRTAGFGSFALQLPLHVHGASAAKVESDSQNQASSTPPSVWASANKLEAKGPVST